MIESVHQLLVSVVITAYNAERWIPQTLDSVLAQTFRDFEVIVVDDGSTDKTPDVIANYGNQVRYLRKENGGQPSARNAGIRSARGVFVAFVDADDLWLPKKLELQMQMFLKCPDVGLVYSDAFIFESQDGQVISRVGQSIELREGDILRSLLLCDFISSATPVVRREVFDSVGYFDESPHLRIGEDWNMWLRIAAKYRVKYVNQPLAKVRMSMTSMTGAMDLQYAYQSKLAIIQNAVTRDPERLADLKDRAVANLLIGMGQWMVKRGDYAGGRGIFFSALRLYPYSIRSLGYLLVAFLPVPLLSWILVVKRKCKPIIFLERKA